MAHDGFWYRIGKDNAVSVDGLPAMYVGEKLAKFFRLDPYASKPFVRGREHQSTQTVSCERQRWWRMGGLGTLGRQEKVLYWKGLILDSGFWLGFALGYLVFFFLFTKFRFVRP